MKLASVRLEWPGKNSLVLVQRFYNMCCPYKKPRLVIWPLVTFDREERGKETGRPGYHRQLLVAQHSLPFVEPKFSLSVRNGSLRFKGTATSDSLIVWSVIEYLSPKRLEPASVCLSVCLSGIYLQSAWEPSLVWLTLKPVSLRSSLDGFVTLILKHVDPCNKMTCT